MPNAKAVLDDLENKREKESPKHYTISGIETIEIIEALSRVSKLTRYQFFFWASAVKYLLRCEHKGQMVSDLDKCIDFLQRLKRSIEHEGKSNGTHTGTVEGAGDTPARTGSTDLV